MLVLSTKPLQKLTGTDERTDKQDHVLSQADGLTKKQQLVKVDVSEIGNEVIVTRKTKAPVDQSKTKKGVLDNLLFCNKLDVIYDQKIEDSHLLSSQFLF